MKTDVKITKYNDLILYSYKGLTIDTSTWENESSAIYCGNINEEGMCCIVRTLYDTLVEKYGEEIVSRYIKDLDKFDEWYDIDSFRFSTEEELFLKWGGIYYDDIYCPNCKSEELLMKEYGSVECKKCGHKFDLKK